MHRLLRILMTLTLGLWLGGLAGLFAFVLALFGENRELAAKGAPVLFRVFATYHLAAAVGALVIWMIWRLRGSSRALTVLLVWIVLGTACALGSSLALGKMEQVRRDDWRENMMDQPTFRKAHIVSNILYVGEFAMVFLGLATVGWGITDRKVKAPAPSLGSGTA